MRQKQRDRITDTRGRPEAHGIATVCDNCGAYADNVRFYSLDPARPGYLDPADRYSTDHSTECEHCTD